MSHRPCAQCGAVFRDPDDNDEPVRCYACGATFPSFNVEQAKAMTPPVDPVIMIEAERIAAVWLAWHREMNHMIESGAPLVYRPPFEWSRDFKRGWAAACAEFTFARGEIGPMPAGYDDPPLTPHGLGGWLAFEARLDP